MPSLVIQENGNYLGKVKISRERTTIGRDRKCDCCLDRSGVAKIHCEVFRYNNRLMLRDVSGGLGTIVNGVPVTSPVPLDPGCEIRLGELVLILEDEEGGAVVGASAGARGAGTRVDPARVLSEEEKLATLTAIRKRLHARLLRDRALQQLDLTAAEEKVRDKARGVADEAIREMSNEIPAWIDRARLLADVLDEVLGLGPLEELLRDATVNEIMVNNWDQVFVERSGLIEDTPARFTDNEQVLHVIRRIVAPLGRRVDESSPMVDARLRDGSRVNAIIPPLALNGPTLTIRKFSKDPYSLSDLVVFGTLSEHMAQFLKLCVEKRKNLLISGGTATGKTTLLNAVSGFIGPKERIITIEDAAELRLHQRHVITLEARPPSVEGTGAVPIRKLVINSLRMRPDRIIVGECRGGEAFDMLQAMNTGHEGSLTTVHGNAPRDALARIENMVLMAEVNLPSRAIRQQIASALHVIVHLQRLPDGSRRITHISEITGMEGDIITLQDIFAFKERELTKDYKIIGDYVYTGVVPKFFDNLRDRGASFKAMMAGQPTG
ncbi:MAG: Flp pilus assembly complex ATPase component TadA [Planctomycetes bacterium]|nr:Flp pilus assembly complex ATPase component TadA [Planctomycetota bacterium]